VASQITSSSASISFSDRIVDTEIERRAHANWTGCSSRILLVIGRAKGAVERCSRELLHCGCEGNRRLRRPVKGTPRVRSGRALRALDRPKRRLGDGYGEMG
jgi:hypothetical protein